jgi:hypothetical protein
VKHHDPEQKDDSGLESAEIFSLTNLIRDESRIEINFWNDRKNELQFLWMGCIAGSALALESKNPLVFIGVPAILGIINTGFAQSRRAGLKRSLDEIHNRHKVYIEFIYKHKILNIIGFERVRKVELGNGTMILEDPVHDDKKREFSSIFTLIDLTIWISLGFIVLGILKLVGIIQTTKPIWAIFAL